MVVHGSVDVHAVEQQGVSGLELVPGDGVGVVQGVVGGEAPVGVREPPRVGHESGAVLSPHRCAASGTRVVAGGVPRVVRSALPVVRLAIGGIAVVDVPVVGVGDDLLRADRCAQRRVGVDGIHMGHLPAGRRNVGALGSVRAERGGLGGGGGDRGRAHQGQQGHHACRGHAQGEAREAAPACNGGDPAGHVNRNLSPAGSSSAGASFEHAQCSTEHPRQSRATGGRRRWVA